MSACMYVQEVKIIWDCKVLPECMVVWVDIHPLQGECPDLPQSVHMPPPHPHFLHGGTCELQLLPCGSVGPAILHGRSRTQAHGVNTCCPCTLSRSYVMSWPLWCIFSFPHGLAVMCAGVMSLLVASHVLRIALQAKTACLLLLDKQRGFHGTD